MRQGEVTDKEIMECGTAKAALRLSHDRSGRSLYAVGLEIGLSESHLSRCLNVQDALNLPHDKVVPFMVACRNAIYLRWLFLRMRATAPELERAGESDRDGLYSELAEVRHLLTEALAEIRVAGRKPDHCAACGAQFALVPGGQCVPRWLLAEAVLIEEEMRGAL